MTSKILGGFFLTAALVACAGGGRSANYTPAELAAMPVVGEGNCRAVVTNFSGRRVEAFYQTGLEERKVRTELELWPLIGYIEIGESVLLRAPCDDRHVIVGWRRDTGAGAIYPGGIIQRETLLSDGITAVRLRTPSEASCSTDNAVNSIKQRCLLPGVGG